jgi:hypothetical protein
MYTYVHTIYVYVCICIHRRARAVSFSLSLSLSRARTRALSLSLMDGCREAGLLPSEQVCEGRGETHIHESLESCGGFADVNRRLLLPLLQENHDVLKLHVTPIEIE